MKRPCLFRRRLVPLGVLTVGLALWTAFLAIVPTEGVRRTIAGRLSRASGREVTLGGVRIGPLGGLHLRGLTIGAPRAGEDPWLRVDEVTVRVGLRGVLRGRIEPTGVDARGVRLRVLRRADGGLELADLLRNDPEISPDPAARARPESAAVEIRVRDATVLVDDRPTGTRLEFTGVAGKGSSEGSLVRVAELSGALDGGRFEFAAQVDRGDPGPTYEGHLRLEGVDLGPGTAAVGYLAPVAAGSAAGLDGKVSLDLYLRGQGATREAFRRSAVGHGQLRLDPVGLDGSRLLSELSRWADLPARGGAGVVHGDLVVKDGRVASDRLTVEVARVAVSLTGWTGFDGQVNYRVRTDRLTGRLPTRARELLSGWAVDPDGLSDVKVLGTVDAPTVLVGGAPLGDPARGGDDRRLREIGRRLRDRIHR